MKIGLFTDIHIGLENSSDFFHKENIKLAKWIKKEFLKQDISDVFILGDVFHNRKQITLESIHNATEFFDILKDFNIHILTGNHDCFFLDNSEIHSLGLLKGWKNITIYDTPEVHTLNNVTIGMIPWGTKINDISICDYIFGHFEISGFEMQGTLCEKGISGSELTTKAKHAVFSGHFHKPQIRKYGDKEIHYLGSPYQHNFGERDEEKYIYVLDLDTHYLERIINNISPKHYYVEQNDDNLSRYSGQIIRPIIKDAEKQEEFMLKLNSVSPTRIKDAEFRIEKEEKIKETIEDFKMTTVSSALKEFIDIMELDDDMKEEVLKETMELYAELGH